MIIKILNNHFVTSFSLHSFVTMLSIGWTFSSRSVSFRMCPIRFLLNWKKKIDITMIITMTIIMYNQRHHDHCYQLANVPYSLPLGVKEKKMTIKTTMTTTTMTTTTTITTNTKLSSPWVQYCPQPPQGRSSPAPLPPAGLRSAPPTSYQIWKKWNGLFRSL